MKAFTVSGSIRHRCEARSLFPYIIVDIAPINRYLYPVTCRVFTCRVGTWCHVGPIRFSPFPTMMRPKRDSDKLRVILDLSYPLGRSVNSSIPVDALDGAQFKLRLPAPSALAVSIRSLGPGCDMFRVDLSRDYRQLRSDPLD